MSQINSFDVFDTALVRRTALPADIFRLTARAIAGEGISLSDLARFEEDFVSARIAAENIAREKALPREDCTLDEIWQELHQLMPDLPAAASGRAEIEVERENIIANPDLADRIRGLQADGKRVIFISDIFHSRQTVFELLHHAGLATAIEQVYCSSESGLLKSTGKLFEHVASAEGVALHDFTHTGDHPISDGVSARSVGMTTRAYGATRLNEAEAVVLAAFGNHPAGSRLAGAMRISRLAGRCDGTASFVSAFLGPIAVLLAVWSFEQARQNGAKRIYFVARDGHVPWRAAAELAGAFSDVECRYIKLSRNSLVAAVPKLGEFGAFWIEKSWSGHSLVKIAELTGHAWKDVEADVARALPHAGPEYRLANQDEIRSYVEILDRASSDAGLSSEGARRQHGTLAYLREQGLFDGVPFMIFDIGWYLNLQAAFKAVLDHSNCEGFVGGLYLGLRTGRVTPHLAGRADGLLYEKPYSPDLPSDANELFDRLILLEHLLGLAPHGTALDYSVPEGKPVSVIEGPISSHRKAATQRISDEVAQFASLLTRYAPEMSQSRDIAKALEALALHFFRSPHAYDLSVLDGLDREDDSGSQRTIQIAEPWNFTTALSQAVPYSIRPRLRLSHGPTLWPEASIAATGLANRQILRSIWTARRYAGRTLRRFR